MKSKILKISIIIISTTLLLAGMAFPIIPALSAPNGPKMLDPTSIPKYVNQITGAPPVYVPTIYNEGTENEYQEYTVEMTKSNQQVLPPGYPKTTVWGYGGMTNLGYIVNSPGPSFEATRDIPIKVTWVNNIHSQHLYTVDPTVHWANPNGMTTPTAPFKSYQAGYAMAQTNVPLVTHVHGAVVYSGSDGGPEQWFTANGIQGPDYYTYEPTTPNAAVYYYNNTQNPTTLWYHDHALGITRLNVMSGLAGFYLLRDPDNIFETNILPRSEYEVPIVIQDRAFLQNGNMYFPLDAVNPDDHPYWGPEFFGDTIMVNGLVWPNMNVDQGWYRLRFLEGSNARFYTLSFVTDYGTEDEESHEFTQIGTDGGYLPEAVTLDEFTFAPGQRVDILINFAGFEAGTTIILKNTAGSPYPSTDPEGLPDPDTVGQIMQFTVNDNPGYTLPRPLPSPLNIIPDLGTPTVSRMLPYFEEFSDIEEPLGVFLTGQKWAAPITEEPELDTTEFWYLINPTGDAHPIHLHLVQFQVEARAPIDAEGYTNAWLDANPLAKGDTDNFVPLPIGTAPNNIDVTPYVTPGVPRTLPEPEEQGWLDTVITPPEYVTVVKVRFAQQDGSAFPFDATDGPGYVWHCHILDHEDNEMMRPYHVLP
ncbi:MAG: multicopper oxidase domain-containing protein [Candidatus Bathyarchaeota archaeon]